MPTQQHEQSPTNHEASVATFRIAGKLLARRSADNSVTVRLFDVATRDATAALDAEEVGKFASWLARRVQETS